MQFLLLIFILIPIIEIGVFIQVGDILGLAATLIVVLITAIIGVNLLKQQGLRAWSDIQLTTAQGKVPAIEMAAAAQLLFAGGLLLTPGFVTDAIGFTLMVPGIRKAIAKKMMNRWSNHISGNAHQSDNSNQFHYHSFTTSDPADRSAEQIKHKQSAKGRTVEGEFEDNS